MISGYDIRENTLTPNSIFLLLLKADEQGCKDVLKDLSAFCKLIDVKIKGFDYVFELSGISDDSMLEKLRVKIDSLSSSFETETLVKTKNDEEHTDNSSISKLNEKSFTKDKHTFPFPKNKKIEKKVITSLNLKGESLPLAKDDIETKEELSPVEKENSTVPPFSPEELKDVAISIEHKKSLFGGIFNKFKNALTSKKDSNNKKEEKKSLQEESASKKKSKNLKEKLSSNLIKKAQEIKDKVESSDLMQQAKELKENIAEELNKNSDKEKEETKETVNPFQDLGSGIIVKKGLLEASPEEIINREKLTDTNPIQAKMQVDDIFAAETVCSFYANNQEEKQPIEQKTWNKEEQSPLDILSNVSDNHIKKEEIPQEKEISEKQEKSFHNLTELLNNKIKKDDLSLVQKDDDPEIVEKTNILEKTEKVKESFVKANLLGSINIEKENPLHIENLHEQKTKKVLGPKNKIEKQEEEKPFLLNTIGYFDKQIQKEKDLKTVKEETEIKNILKKTTEDSVLLKIDSLSKEKEKKSFAEKKGILHPKKVSEIKERKDMPISIDYNTLEEEKHSKSLKKEKKIKEENSIISSEKSQTTEKPKIKAVISEKAEQIKQRNNEKITKPFPKLKKVVQQEVKKEKVLPIKKEIKKEILNMQENNKKTNLSKQPAQHKEEGKPFQQISRNLAAKNFENIDHTLHISAPSQGMKAKTYPIEMPLIPTYTFANMDNSPIRFAHAMGMSTLENLGTLNNPLLLQGESGTGKTHFLHAMGYEISKKIPQSKILFTNGVRLSRGIQSLLERGKREKLDDFFNNVEVLIIDDIHLTAVNEHNREYISNILNDFLKNKKQIILSSKYPPESLKRFEELVNFKLSMGAIAELKVPNQSHFSRLTKKMISNADLSLTEDKIQEFFFEENKSLGDVARQIKRVKVLSRRIESSGLKKMSYEDILTAMTRIKGEDENSEIVKKSFEDVTSLQKHTGHIWGNFGFFFPASEINKFRWVAFASQEAAKELGIKGGFNYSLKSAYSTEHIISAAFKIANICDVKGLKGAVILGPSLLECKEPIRENFYDILTHMLEVMMIRCGTINFEDIKKPSAYVRMLGDILK